MPTEGRLRFSRRLCASPASVLSLGRSRRITSAPASASNMQAYGAGPIPPSSMTLIPSSGPLTDQSLRHVDRERSMVPGHGKRSQGSEMRIQRLGMHATDRADSLRICLARRPAPQTENTLIRREAPISRSEACNPYFSTVGTATWVPGLLDPSPGAKTARNGTFRSEMASTNGYFGEFKGLGPQTAPTPITSECADLEFRRGVTTHPVRRRSNCLDQRHWVSLRPASRQ